MRSIECAPDNIENSGESCAQAIEPNANFHLLISDDSLSVKPKPDDDPPVSPASGPEVWLQQYIEQSHFRKRVLDR
jgi:hypothetical protein